MVSPSHKKEAVGHVVTQRLCSVRRACRYLGLSRSTYRYCSRPPTDRQQQLHERIVALSWQCPRYGYRRIRALLAAAGWTVSRKQVQRIRRREGLKVCPRPKKIPRQGVSTGLPTQARYQNHVWSWDFLFDRTENGGTLKMMTLLDEYSRQSLAIQGSVKSPPTRCWWSAGKRWQPMVFQDIFAATTVLSLSPSRSSSGYEIITSRRSTSIPGAPGRMAILSAFTVAFATNAWRGRFCSTCVKRGS